jgi:hypothetical protein
MFFTILTLLLTFFFLSNIYYFYSPFFFQILVFKRLNISNIQNYVHFAYLAKPRWTQMLRKNKPFLLH